MCEHDLGLTVVIPIARDRVVSALFWHSSRLNDQLALHRPVMPSTMNTTPERISSRGLCHKLNCLCLLFLYFQAILRGRENQSWAGGLVRTFRKFLDLEPMRMVGRGDLELDLRALFDSNGGWSEVVPLGRDFNDLDLSGRVR